MSFGVGGLPLQVGPGRNMEVDRTRLPFTRAGGLRREVNLQIRFSPAWGLIALASTLIVFSVGPVTLDGTPEEGLVIRILQADRG